MSVLEIEAAVTSRGQTTIPAAVRKALRVGQPGAIIFRVEDDGLVTLAKKEPASDPVIEQFLAFLAADMMASPEALRPVTGDWLNSLQGLVQGVAFDLDAPLSDADE